MPHSKPALRKKHQTLTPRNKHTTALLPNAQALINNKDFLKIALYHPIEDEPDLLPLITQNPSISFSLPKITDTGMVFASYKYGDKLAKNSRYSCIFEPKSDDIVIPDIMFVPGVAFDIRGYRLGRGKGFYDKYIALYPNILTIGVTFQEKLLERLPQEAHDCRMQYIITENFILHL